MSKACKLSSHSVETFKKILHVHPFKISANSVKFKMGLYRTVLKADLKIGSLDLELGDVN